MSELNGRKKMEKDRQAVEHFNQRLDALLAGETPPTGELDREDRRALELAAHLERVDLSRHNRGYFRLRQELMQAAGRKPARRPAARLATRSLSILVVMVLAGWAIASLVRQPAQVSVPRSTAYRLPAGASATMLASSNSPHNLADQGPAISPQPAPTPHAPVEVVSAAPPGYHSLPILLSASPTQSMTRRPQVTNP
jgi:hypothetical protein